MVRSFLAFKAYSLVLPSGTTTLCVSMLFNGHVLIFE